MQRSTQVRMLAAMGLCWLGGCSIAGEWRTQNPEQFGPQFPLYSVTFEEDKRYSAAGGPGAQERTSTGTYSWNGSELKLMPTRGPQRSYKGRLNIFKEELVFNRDAEGKKVDPPLVLQKVESQPK
jgi:hypothetical protein